MTTTKTKSLKFLTYFITFLCGIAFYSHQFFPNTDDDKELLLAKKEYISAKKKNTALLNKIKITSKGTTLYASYKEANKNKNIAFEELNKIKKSKQYFGFKSFSHFVERFGLMLCFFIYALYNLIKSIKRKGDEFGNKFIHTFIISICFFHFFWIFQQFQDFSKSAYIFMTLFSAAVVFAAVYLIFKERKTKEEYLRDSLLRMARFTFKNTKPEKRDEMLEMIKKIAN